MCIKKSIFLKFKNIFHNIFDYLKYFFELIYIFDEKMDFYHDYKKQIFFPKSVNFIPALP